MQPETRSFPQTLLSPFQKAISELFENLESTAQIERLWLIGRTSVALVGVGAAALVLNGTDSASVIYAGGAIVLVANIILLLMLRRGLARQVAIAGLLLDNLVIFAIWTGSLGLTGETRPSNDLYLGFFPIFILWSFRLGFKLGVPYTAIWMLWISWTVNAFLPADSYEAEQLPVRIAFLSVTSVLGMWTARLLKTQRKIAYELSLRADSLQELDRAKDQFIATVSHELKTPMAAILGFTRLLRADVTNDLETERLDVIRRNGERLSVLIDDLLDISRIQNGSLRLSVEPVEVCEFVEKTVSDLNSVVGARGHVITVDISHEQCWINGDRTRLAQILTNLITNASKYSPAGSEIRVCSKVEQQALTLSVSDDGDGMSPDDQVSLFKPFYRTAAARNSSVPGTGLGLFISKQITESHGGQLNLTSEIGKGTTVEIRLPNASFVPTEQTGTTQTFTNAFDELEEAG